ncbi:MAG: hypothetical protein CMO01_03615 [Thalassobius sp.]|nr:hypothetical protein [Thalassovita sp.]
MKRLFLLTVGIVLFQLGYAQDEPAPVTISGSVDTYYKYDFSDHENIGTSFGEDQNSFSIGMANLIFSGETGKASFVADLSFGPRSAGSLPGGNSGAFDPSFNIQNLYVSYALTDKLSVTGGYMGTFVGYEVISPVGNFNYSTSYLFTNGPFQNAGLKFDYAFSDRVALMVGLFNDWNVYSDENDVADFGAQLYVSPVDGWDAYINLITGPESGTEFDITTTYQITDAFMLGLNAATYSAPDFESEGGDIDGGSFTGAALYAQYAFTDNFSLGLRGESFTDDNLGILSEGKAKVTAFTISGNIGSGPLKLIPELRLDSADQEIFLDADDAPTKSAVQFLVAAVFGF